MDFGLTEAQQMIKTSAKEFLERECPKSFVRAMEHDERGFTPELWRRLAQVGWLRMPFPEESGGDGQDFVTVALLLEEMARACLPGPYFTSVALCGLPIAQFGSPAQKREYLKKIGDGQLIMSLATLEPSVRYDTAGVQLEATARDGGFVLNGTKLLVPYANSADSLLVSARTKKTARPRAVRTATADDGITMFIVPTSARGISLTPLKTIAYDPQHEVAFNNVQVGRDAVLGQVDGGAAIFDKISQWGAVGSCAMMVGAADKVLEMTVEYVKSRVAFGRPIGAFQAIQHHCANMAVDAESSRAITFEAAWHVAEGLPETDRMVSMAKGWTSEATRHLYALGHQCHGAIGLTLEYDLQLYSRRCKVWEMTFGDANYHQDRLTRLAGL
ncbi:MAG: acyl-CoA/acyl-ACP dehydrogenase [Chloroflexi bacterium]|nr:acyl-CoA/acyl-ACP dehydrogenase [Chloroflexota bacterium]